MLCRKCTFKQNKAKKRRKYVEKTYFDGKLTTPLLPPNNKETFI